MIKQVLISIVFGAAVLTVGILIGHFGITKSGSSTPSWVKDVAKDVDEDFVEKFMSTVDNIQIQENLRELTKVPHMATTAGDEETVNLMLKRWQDPSTGLDQAWREEYLVHLSFPDPKNPNKVTVVSPSDTVLHTAREKEKSYTPDQDDPEVVQPYAAYSPPGHPQGKLVYANQGKPGDYQKLNETVDLRGTIAITRYGGAGRAAKAINAAPYGVIGVLVYTDPLDINDGLMSDVNETYPHSWYMPPSGVERGSFNTHYGDMRTPYLAAKDETYRIPVEDITGIPPIPIQPIGFEDAYILICALDGEAAPSVWQGAFNCTYNFGGPGFTNTSAFNNSDVRLDIFNNNVLKNSSNVMGIIRGSVEPDRYVIYGNHRDSWVHGAIDPSSGTSVMLEITRVLGQMVKQGLWRPRRSIIFGSWGAEEFGLIGSAEYTEQYFAKLSERTIAYINVDIAVFANASLRASGMPSVQNVLFKAAKQVKAAGLDTSVYDNWIQYFNRTSPAHGIIPRVGYLTGAGSDYAAFVHYLGITSMDISYIYDRSKTKARIYPAYHTAYDTFDYASKFIDPGFVSHQAVARTAGNVLIRLADSLVLPLNCSDYAESLEDYLKTAVRLYEDKLQAKGISMEPLKRAVANFRSAATHLDQVILTSDLVNETPMTIRRINDQLMLLDRAFLDPLAFPDKYAYRHVIWASSSAGKQTFPGLADAYANAELTGQPRDWDKVHYHLSVLSQAIEGAANTLVDVI
ncbi:N-acetylated-alpha-linked acidic dipeptidase-like protein [Collichthys lucidus]|uniref:Aminopeptidase NAALADL1 n=1 Tax=Collichthys lucidus TaxID=240159 RepID=A0A4U5UTC0_COLLU|nr:N-acetylated-alpha-linked acidic dipeptidase-like protein [Collichthys lucidus]